MQHRHHKTDYLLFLRVKSSIHLLEHHGEHQKLFQVTLNTPWLANRRTGSSVSENINCLCFSCTILSWVYKEWQLSRKNEQKAETTCKQKGCQVFNVYCVKQQKGYNAIQINIIIKNIHTLHERTWNLFILCPMTNKSSC